jgi:hypothetical protein
MPYSNMSFSLHGQVPGLEFPLAQSFINEALGHCYDVLMWSFQFKESGWLTPGLLFQVGSPIQSAGTITATAYSDQIVGDATAAAAWLAYQTAGTLPLLTSFQIRNPFYSIYNIVAFDGVNTFTIDRPWMDVPGAGLTYMVYQCYFPVPVIDFKRFFEIQDPVNAAPIDFWTKTRDDLALDDPQRTNFNLPAFAIPYEVDARAGSPTLGYMLYELWPHPLAVRPYNFAYLRRGDLLSAPTDTVPPPLNEELIMWRAKEVAYQWKEAQKGEGIARGAGADWRFLSERADKEFLKKLKICADLDRDKMMTYFRRFVRYAAIGATGQPFATIGGQLNVGR